MKDSLCVEVLKVVSDNDFDALKELDHQPSLLFEISPDIIKQAFGWLSERGFVR